MVTAIAVLGVLAGSLSALFGIDASAADGEPASGAGPPGPEEPVHAELAALATGAQQLAVSAVQ